MIRTLDDAAVKGRLWIEPKSGRSRGPSRFRLGRSSALIRVSYARQPNVDVWVPVSMEETYQIRGGLTIVGKATYSNFRKFIVAVDTVIANYLFSLISTCATRRGRTVVVDHDLM
jgi:hypothetical protein